jgi:hypothetical protein
LVQNGTHGRNSSSACLHGSAAGCRLVRTGGERPFPSRASFTRVENQGWRIHPLRLPGSLDAVPGDRRRARRACGPLVRPRDRRRRYGARCSFVAASVARCFCQRSCRPRDLRRRKHVDGCPPSFHTLAASWTMTNAADCATHDWRAAHVRSWRPSTSRRLCVALLEPGQVVPGQHRIGTHGEIHPAKTIANRRLQLPDQGPS